MKGRILVVDDDPDVRSFLTAALGRAGYACDEATDGSMATEMARRNRYNIVFMDLLMPGQSGLESIIQIKNISPQTAIAVISVVSDEASMRRLFDAGATVYLRKPFTAEDILRTTEALLN